jgi:DNA-binding SARP family transcriptional activator
VAEFEAHLRDSADTDFSPRERAEAWRRAIALYQGDYLSDIFMDWTTRRREELQGQYLIALNHLADWELSRQRYNEAKALYDRVIEIDPYRDEAHAGIISCLTRMGAPAAARAYFLAYKKVLYDDLGAQPTSALQAIYDRIGQ